MLIANLVLRRLLGHFGVLFLGVVTPKLIVGLRRQRGSLNQTSSPQANLGESLIERLSLSFYAKSPTYNQKLAPCGRGVMTCIPQRPHPKAG